jgi:hypothetical protein
MISAGYDRHGDHSALAARRMAPMSNVAGSTATGLPGVAVLACYEFDLATVLTLVAKRMARVDNSQMRRQCYCPFFSQ